MTAVVLCLLGRPVLTAAVVLAVGHRSPHTVRGAAVAGSALCWLLAVVVAGAHLGDAAPLRRVVVETASVGQPLGIVVWVDPLSCVLLLLATTVSLLVQVYSLGYLARDPRYPSYAALVSLFTGAMATVVVADDLWMLLVGWELMGACSYFLISHHWELPEARAGAVKAFLVTRTADLGLLFGILVLGERFGTYRISEILSDLAAAPPMRDALWLPALLLLVAVLGKSAQVPFHTWLPDAMPGPTPISALIHAATMVAAGVFLVARMHPLFLVTPRVLTLLAVLASVTMVLAAAYALVADDLKRVLAWSTVSQLAYMFGALAAGAWSAGVLHLLAHGAFKALLFLGAGAVVHAVGSTSLSRMGGLRTALPHTFAAMTVGFAALAGVVPLVGFFTKDAVIGAAWEEARDGRLLWPWVAWLLVAAMLLTAVLTVAYAMRAWLLAFFGPTSPEHTGRAPHDPPATMRVPLYVLMVPSVLGGVVVLDPAAVLGPGGGADLLHGAEALTTTVLVALTGLAVVLLWRRRGRAVWPAMTWPHLPVDVLVERGLVRPVLRLAQVVRAGERDVVDAYAEGTEASVRGVGRLLRRTQTGRVQSYLLVVVVGAVAVAVLAGSLA